MAKKIHIIGIEGAGTSALAQIYKSMGFDVSGSDNGDHFYGPSLAKQGIKVSKEFSEKNVPSNAQFVVYSTAFKEDNPEISEARFKRLKIMSYPEALGELFNQKVGVAVCGTHGKTTTSAMLAEALIAAGEDPSAIVGSRVISWDGSAVVGKGKFFVAETDEYQNKLQYYNPWAAILTSVDWDHPDFFPDFSTYKEVFKSFVKKIPAMGKLIVWGDSSDTLEVAQDAKCKVYTYGFGEDNDYFITRKQNENVSSDKCQSFEIFKDGNSLGIFETPLVGKHNVLNAASVVAFCNESKIEISKIREALKNFKGTARRFQQVGVYKNIILIDDYAHHPDEIRATLSGARELFGDKRIYTVFHPHTFTRTRALLQEFAQSFDDSDKVIVIDIYGSARELHGGITSEELVKLINKYFPEKADYVPSIEEAAKYLKEVSDRYDVLITMGAGDVWKIGKELAGEKNN